MIKADWNIFKVNFSENPQNNFERLCYLLFCKEYNKPYGILRFKNQSGIETNPIVKDNDVIGWQAKFYETKLSDHKDDLVDTIRRSKKYYPTLTKIIFYTNQEWSQGKNQNDPQAKIEVEQKANEAKIGIEWRTASFFESPFVTIDNLEIARYFFSLKRIFDSHRSSGFFFVNSDLYATESAKYPAVTPEHFYTFRQNAQWIGIFNSWDYHGGCKYESLLEKIQNADMLSHSQFKPIVAIEGKSGTGKSVLLRRLALDLYKKGRTVAWVCDFESFLENIGEYSQFESEMSNSPTYIFIDEIDELLEKPLDILKPLIMKNPNLIFIVAGQDLTKLHILPKDDCYINIESVYDNYDIINNIGDNMQEWREKIQLMSERKHLNQDGLFYILYILKQDIGIELPNLEDAFLECLAKDIRLLSSKCLGLVRAIIALAFINEQPPFFPEHPKCEISVEIFLKLANIFEDSLNHSSIYDEWFNDPETNAMTSRLLSINEYSYYHNCIQYVGILKEPFVQGIITLYKSKKITNILEGKKEFCTYGTKSFKKYIFKTIMNFDNSDKRSQSLLLSAFYYTQVIDATECIQYINKLIEQKNGHHTYMCLLVNKQSNINISESALFDYLYKMLSFTSETPYFWSQVYYWIEDKYQDDKNKKLEIMMNLYNKGCLALHILRGILAYSHKYNKNKLMQSWLNNDDMINNDILLDCMKNIGHKYHERILAIFDNTTNTKVKITCIRSLKTLLLNRIIYLLELENNNNILKEYLSILNEAGKYQYITKILKITNDQTVILYCLELLKNNPTEEVCDIFTKMRNNLNIVIACFDAMPTHVAKKYANSVGMEILAENKIKDNSELLLKCLEILGEDSIIEVNKLCSYPLNIDTIIKLLKFATSEYKTKKAKEILNCYLENLNIHEQNVITCLTYISNEDQLIYTRKLIERDSLPDKLMTKCINIVGFEIKDMLIIKLIKYQENSFDVIFQCVKQLGVESKPYFKKILVDPHYSCNNYFVSLCLDYLDCNDYDILIEVLNNYKNLNRTIIFRCMKIIEIETKVKDEHEILVYNCLKYIGKEARYFAVRGLSRWGNLSPKLLNLYVKLAGAEQEALLFAKDVLTTSWITSNEIVKSAALIVPSDLPERKERAKELLNKWTHRENINRYLLYSSMCAFWDNYEEIAFACYYTLSYSKRDIKYQKDNPVKYHWHIIKALSNPSLRKISFFYADDLLNYEKDNQGSLSNELHNVVKRIKVGSFPKWSIIDDENEIDFQKCSIEEYLEPDDYIDINLIQIPSYFNNPPPEKLARERTFFHRYGKLSGPIFINGQKQIKDRYATFIVAQELMMDVVPVVYCDNYAKQSPKPTPKIFTKPIHDIGYIVNQYRQDISIGEQAYLPEGWDASSVYSNLATNEILMDTKLSGKIISGKICYVEKNKYYYVDIGRTDVLAILPYNQSCYFINKGIKLEINKDDIVQVKIVDIQEVGSNDEKYIEVGLSRIAAQQEAAQWLLYKTQTPIIVNAIAKEVIRVGVYVDIGAGVLAFLRIEDMCKSRTEHAKERLRKGDKLRVVVSEYNINNTRNLVRCKELLMTDMDVYNSLNVGDTLEGIVRNKEKTGSGFFVELGANLSGLLDINKKTGKISPGDKIYVRVIEKKVKNNEPCVDLKYEKRSF